MPHCYSEIKCANTLAHEYKYMHKLEVQLKQTHYHALGKLQLHIVSHDTPGHFANL